MLLSDGMGSGKMASLASEVSAMFLDKMLSAGAGLEITLRMLNHILRANTGEVSTTVDLCELDRVTGEVKFVKSGAAPSYVIRGDSLFKRYDFPHRRIPVITLIIPLCRRAVSLSR